MENATYCGTEVRLYSQHFLVWNNFVIFQQQTHLLIKNRGSYTNYEYVWRCITMFCISISSLEQCWPDV